MGVVSLKINFTIIGIGWDTNTVDLSRYMVTKDLEDIGMFKTPTLRSITETGPYMHDRRFKPLEEVGGVSWPESGLNTNLSPLIKALELTNVEWADLVAFLNTLTGKPITFEMPKLPK